MHEVGRSVDGFGRRYLILPGQVMKVVPAEATEDEIKAEFQLDRLVDSPRVVLSPSGGVCLDGPPAGLTLDYVYENKPRGRTILGHNRRLNSASIAARPGPSTSY